MSAILANHVVKVIVAGKQVDGWGTYTIPTSMLRPAESFSLERPFDRAAWNLHVPDAPITITIDDVAVLTGFIDDSDHPEDSDTINITGRSKVGRLVQESAATIDYRGLGAAKLIERLAADWFTTVNLTNERNRRVTRGKGHKVPAGDEPIRLDGRKKAGTRIEPGQMLWHAIEEILRQAGWLAWSSGDGTELIVSTPNYNQAAQWHVFHPAERTLRGDEGNALSFGVKRSTGDRYSRIIVVGNGAGTAVNYGAAVSSRLGEARNNPATAQGDGLDFSAPKRLVVVEALQSREEATRYAEQEMAKRDISGKVISVTMPLHGQLVAGQRPTLFTFDTMGLVQDEVTGTKGAFLCTGCTYTGVRGTLASTRLEMVPKGTRLSV